MVNSIQVYSDVLRFFPKLSVPSRLWLLPKLLPRLQYDATEVLTRLGLTPRGYFIVCSQSWPHKRHDLVIEAFARYHDFGGEIAMLVCTGSRTAYNWLESERSINALVAKLGVSDRVVFTGELNSHDYLTLLSRAACLVQASEVEGGCGAGGVLEAGVLGTPVILSDTIVNRELWFGQCSFFVSGSAQSLAQKMKDFTISQQQRRDPLSEKQIASVADNFCTRVSLFLRQISDC
jgi:glycosyltransferase involved in cell wall biosynthesis